METKDPKDKTNLIRAYLRAAWPFAVIAPVIALGYLLPVPGARVPNVEVWTSPWRECVMHFSFGYCDYSHLDAIATVPGGVYLGAIAAAAVAVLSWRRFTNHKRSEQ